VITARWACPVDALSRPVYTAAPAAPADDVTSRALTERAVTSQWAITSQLMPAYDVIDGQ